MDAFRIMDRGWSDYEWGLALVALFLIWRGNGAPHRRRKSYGGRHVATRAHLARQRVDTAFGEWINDKIWIGHIHDMAERRRAQGWA
mgnify:CR=1 FL=1